MLILGLDLETTGLDIEKDRVIEIALVLYDTDLKIPLKMYSEFIHEPDAPAIDKNKVPAIMTDEMIACYGIDMTSTDDRNDLFGNMFDMVKEAEYIVAHNGNQFDKPMLKKFFVRYEEDFLHHAWIDTRTDIEYPKFCASRNLVYLAAYHGFVNPFPHRALFDVMTMLKVFSEYDVEEIVTRMRSPLVLYKALVDYNNKDLAKAVGFSWSEFTDCPYKGQKIWYKDIKECDVTEEWMEGLEFDIKKLIARKESEIRGRR